MEPSRSLSREPTRRLHDRFELITVKNVDCFVVSGVNLALDQLTYSSSISQTFQRTISQTFQSHLADFPGSHLAYFPGKHLADFLWSNLADFPGSHLADFPGSQLADFMIGLTDANGPDSTLPR